MDMELITKMSGIEVGKKTQKINDEYKAKIKKSLNRIKKMPSILMMGRDNKAQAVIRLEMMLNVEPLAVRKFTDGEVYNIVIMFVQDFLFEDKVMNVFGITKEKILNELMEEFECSEGRICSN